MGKDIPVIPARAEQQFQCRRHRGPASAVAWRANSLSPNAQDESILRINVLGNTTRIRQNVCARVRGDCQNDRTLPLELREYVASLVVEIQSVLDKYEMTGDFVLADALNRLFAAVFMAETQTRDKSRWQKFKEEKAGPFMQAFLGLALPNILSAAQLVLQITQG